MFSRIFSDIFAWGGCITGKFVRDYMMRDEPYGDRIQVILPFEKFPFLDNIMSSYGAECEMADCDLVKRCASNTYCVGDHYFDISSEEYMGIPNIDCDALCWTGKNITTWFTFNDDFERLYGFHFDTESIIKRCKNKQLVNIDCNLIHVKKLKDKGWNILN